MMDVRWRAAAGHVMRLDRADHAAGVPAVDANDHGNAENVYLLAAVVGNWIGFINFW